MSDRSIRIYIHINIKDDYKKNLEKLYQNIVNSGLINQIQEIKVLLSLDSQNDRIIPKLFAGIIDFIKKTLNPTCSSSFLSILQIRKDQIQNQLRSDAQDRDFILLYLHTNFEDEVQLDSQIYVNIIQYRKHLESLNNLCSIEINRCHFNRLKILQEFLKIPENLNNSRKFWWSKSSFFRERNVCTNSNNFRHKTPILRFNFTNDMEPSNRISEQLINLTNVPSIAPNNIQTTQDKDEQNTEEKCPNFDPPPIPSWIIAIVIVSIIYLIISWILWIYVQK